MFHFRRTKKNPQMTMKFLRRKMSTKGRKKLFKCAIGLLIGGLILAAISFVGFFLGQYLVEKGLVDVSLTFIYLQQMAQNLKLFFLTKEYQIDRLFASVQCMARVARQNLPQILLVRREKSATNTSRQREANTSRARTVCVQ